MQTGSHTLERPIESQRGAPTVLGHEQLAVSVEPSEAFTEQRLEVLANRPETPTCGRRGRRVEHDSRKALTRLHRLHDVTPVSAQRAMPARIDPSLSVGREIHFEPRQIRAREVDRKNFLGARGEKRNAEGPRMRE